MCPLKCVQNSTVFLGERITEELCEKMREKDYTELNGEPAVKFFFLFF